jgi:hypothetical protein
MRGTGQRFYYEAQQGHEKRVCQWLYDLFMITAANYFLRVLDSNPFMRYSNRLISVEVRNEMWLTVQEYAILEGRMAWGSADDGK